tara:strand:+ start:2755 stop:2931 length:177 start_codon:yes stop_codon:yes gene_type:complete
MTKQELGAFIELLMCADPWPCGGNAERVLKEFADAESKRQGFNNWIDAYHRIHWDIKT